MADNQEDGRGAIDYSIETTSRILAATESLIRRKGIRAVSFEKIAEMAGVTRGAIYYNFKGRDDLFLRLVEKQMERRISTLTQVFKNTPGARRVDVIAAGLTLDVMEWRVWSPLFIATWLDAIDSEPLMRRLVALRKGFYAEITKILLQAFPEANSKAADDFAALLIGFTTGLSIEASFDTVKLTQLEAFLVDLLKRNFCGEAN